MKLANMAGMAVLLKETTDRRSTEQVEAESLAYFTEVLDFNGQSHEESYTLAEWESMKLNFQVGYLLKIVNR